MQGFICSNALVAKDCTASNGGNFEIRISFSSCLRPQPRSRRRQGYPTGLVAQLGPAGLGSLDQAPTAVSDGALQCYGRGIGQLGPPLLIYSIDALGDLLGLSPRCVRVIQEFSFQPRHWIF